jgi:deazaflavin-dependent oxidoreductase (nitroreductase family)
MPKKHKELKPPTGFSRLLWRFPIIIFRMGLGWLFAGRMLLLEHTGRKSGLHRQNVLEVVGHDQQTDTYYVVAGFGPKSQWYQNILACPDVSIRVGRRHLDVHAQVAPDEEAGEVLLQFAQDNPSEAKLVGLLGYEVDGTDEDWRALGHELLLIALRPRA